MTSKLEDRLREISNSGEAPGASLLEPLLVKPLEAARLIGESRSTIYRLIHSGQISAVKRGATTLLVVESLRRYVAALPPFTRRAA